MNKTVIFVLSIIGIIVVAGLLCVGQVVSTYNQAVDLKTQIVAKQTDNKSRFDKMWKTISQTAQVTDAQKNALKEIFTSYATARNGNGANAGGSLATWIKEAVPNVDTSTFNNLQNIIASERDAFAERQTELLDMSREYNRLLQRFPSNFILAALGQKPIDIQIVTSTKTEKSFETGKDDDTQVFPK